MTVAACASTRHHNCPQGTLWIDLIIIAVNTANVFVAREKTRGHVAPVVCTLITLPKCLGQCPIWVVVTIFGQKRLAQVRAGGLAVTKGSYIVKTIVGPRAPMSLILHQIGGLGAGAAARAGQIRGRSGGAGSGIAVLGPIGVSIAVADPPMSGHSIRGAQRWRLGQCRAPSRGHHPPDTEKGESRSSPPILRGDIG